MRTVAAAPTAIRLFWMVARAAVGHHHYDGHPTASVASGPWTAFAPAEAPLLTFDAHHLQNNTSETSQ